MAREAGTGKTSVSRYLNGETQVLSEDLRQRIEAAIQRLNYRPNQMARGLKRGRNRLLGMLVADLTNHANLKSTLKPTLADARVKHRRLDLGVRTNQ